MADKKITDPLVTTVIPQAGDLLPLGRPGSSDALRTLASGMVLIERGQLGENGDAIDIELPQSYSRFFISIKNLVLLVSSDTPYAVFSEDGGVTFPTNVLTYADYIWADSSDNTNTFIQDGGSPLALNQLTQNIPSSFTLEIYPGSDDAGDYPWVRSWYQFATTGSSGAHGGVVSFRTAAVTRQNYVRIASYMTAVPDPGPGPQISQGASWTLIGVV